jgi:two-component system, sensor histidine kinase and response regulator
MNGISIYDIIIIISILAASISLFIAFYMWRRRQAERAYWFVPLAYETILNNIPTGVVVTDMRNRIIAINKSAKRYMDSSIIDPIGQSVKDVFPAYTSYIYSSRMEAESQDVWHIGDRTFEVELSPMIDERGIQRGHVYLLHDTTAEVKAEAALKESERLFDIAFSQALDGFFFMLLDEPIRWDDTVDKGAVLDYAMEHQRMTQVNDAMLEQYGATREQLIGRTLADFFAHDLTAGRESVRQGYENGRMRIETEERTIDGRPIWIEGDYICLYDAEGQITGNFAVQRDVTARKQAEAQLLESEYRYRMLFENNADAVFWIGTDFIHLSANSQAATMLGYTVDELVGMRTSQLVPPDELDKSQAALQRLLDGEQFPIYERWLRRKNGERLLVEVNIALIRDSDGNPQYIQSILHDITERKKAEQQSLALGLEKQRVQLLTGFIRDTSHEFRNPLAVIQSSLYIIQKTNSPEKREEKLLSIRYQVERLAQLVDRLVMMTQLDSGMLFSLHKQNVNSLVQQVTDTMRTAFAEKNLTVQLQLTKTLPTIEVDAIHLAEALSQLIDNAVRYSLPNGTVTIETNYQAEWLTIAIADTGIGISDEALPRIFERFYRYDEAHSTPGFGLGLSIAQKIIELHGGRIEVQSEAGKGSRFVIYLPIQLHR